MKRRDFLGVSGVGATALLSGRQLAPSRPSWICIESGGERERSQYAGLDQAVSMGSLLKPFLALAYLQAQGSAPAVRCHGSADGCWKPDGHGRLTLGEALAFSCNAYFLCLSRELNRAALEAVCLTYGLAVPEREWSGSRLIGIGEGWPQTPRATARAFAQLANEGRSHAAVGSVLQGMEMCATSGTAKLAQLSCYAKTGTARCSHMRSGAGDGYVVAMTPTGRPRRVLLAMQHGVTGSHAAGYLREIVSEAL